MNPLIYLLIFVVVVALLGFLMLRSNPLRSAAASVDAFWDELHLTAFAHGVLRVRRAALAQIEEGDAETSGADDAQRTLQTELELSLFYTVSKVGSEYVHHASISYPDDVNSAELGHQFAAFALAIWGVPPAAVTLQVSPGRVFHLTFILSAEGQERFAELEPAAPARSDIQALWDEAQASRGELTLEQM